MAIHEQAYQVWQGSERPRILRITTIAWKNVRVVLSNIWVLLLLLACFLVVAGYTFLFFLLSQLPEVVRLERFIPEFMSNNVYRTFLNTDFGGMLLFAIIAAVTGTGLISRDLRTNAVPIYLSRPITKLDYLLGKGLALAGFLLASTLAPALFIWVSAWMIGNEEIGLGTRLLDLAGILVNCAVIVIPMTAIVLALSSMTRRAGLAAVYWILLYMGTWVLSESLSWNLKEDTYDLVSLPGLVYGVALHLYEIRVPVEDAEKSFGLLEPLVILGTVTAIAIGVLWVRFRKFEEN